MTDRLDKVSDLAIAPITSTPHTASDTVFTIDDKVGDIGLFADPLTQGYDAWVWARTTHPNVGDAGRNSLAEKVRVTAKGASTLTVTRGPSPLTMNATGVTYWIVAAVSSQVIEDIDDRIFDFVGGELVRDINVEMADCRADDARFAGTPWFDVTHSDYGATGDGAADDGPAVALAFDAAEAAGGGVVYFPAGDYLLTTWPTAGNNYAAPLTLVGDGQGSIITGVAGDHFLDVSDELVVRDLEFSGFNSVFDLDGATGTVERFDVENCKATGCVRFASWLTPEASGKYTQIRIHNCRILSATTAAIEIGASATGLGWESLKVTENYIDGGSGGTMADGILIGFEVTSSVSATQAKWKNSEVSRNTVLNAVGGATIAEGIAVFGDYCHVDDNYVQGVSGSPGGQTYNNGIRAGIRYGTVSRNKIQDISGSVNTNNGINLFGESIDDASPVFPILHGVDCCDNVIVFDGVVTDGVAIAFEKSGSEINVERNIAYEAVNFLRTIDNTQADWNRIRIVDNTVRNAVVPGSAMILQNDGTNWTIRGNYVEGFSVGLQFGAATYSRVTISENHYETTSDGILIGGAQAISQVAIIGNMFVGCTDAVQVSTTITTPDDFYIAGNTYSGVTNEENFSGLTPTNLRIMRSDIQDSREQITFEQDTRLGDGAWDGDHLIVGTRRFWADSNNVKRVNTSVPASSLDGSPDPFPSHLWSGATLRFGDQVIWVTTGGVLRIKSSAPASSLDGAIIASSAPTYLEGSITSSIQIPGATAWIQNTVTVSGALPGEMTTGEHENSIPEVIINTVCDATDKVRCTFVRTGVAGSTFNLSSGTQRAGVIRT